MLWYSLRTAPQETEREDEGVEVWTSNWARVEDAPGVPRVAPGRPCLLVKDCRV